MGGMSNGIMIWIRATLMGLVVLIVLALSGSPGQAFNPHRQGAQGAAFVWVQNDHRHDDGDPCKDPGILPGPACCAGMHGATAAVLPLIAAAECHPSGVRAKFSALAAPQTEGIPVAPALPPPRPLH
jgi:hypothetical protein